MKWVKATEHFTLYDWKFIIKTCFSVTTCTFILIPNTLHKYSGGFNQRTCFLIC